jgi:hypothetical protein
VKIPIEYRPHEPPASNVPPPGSLRMAWWTGRINELRLMFPETFTLQDLATYFKQAERDCTETEATIRGEPMR